MLGSSRAPLSRNGPEVVLTGLRRFAALTTVDETLIRGLNDWRRDPVNVELVRDQMPFSPRYLVAGWAARVRWLGDGRRQIVGLVLPGDGLGICRRPQPISVCAVVALTPVQTIDGQPVLRALAGMAEDAPLSRAVNTAAAMDEAWLIDQVVRLGRLTAYERIVHLILEIRCRLLATGIGTPTQIPFPLTQETLADASGLSIVHVNRTLQQLRRDGLIELKAGRLTLLDVETMMGTADFREPQPSGWLSARDPAA